MQIVEETSVAPPRMTGVAGALQKAEQWLGNIVAAAAAGSLDSSSKELRLMKENLEAAG